MKLSRSSEYALMGVAYIALNQKSRPVLASRIAEEYGIPVEYLLKILQQLVRTGVLISKRGPRGGFTLAKPANKVSLVEIIEAVEGPIRGEAYMAEQTNNVPFSLKMEEVCSRAAEAMRKVCEKATLADMIGAK